MNRRYSGILFALPLCFLLQPGSAQTPTPVPTPTIEILKTISSVSGIRATLSLSYTRTLSVVITTQDPTNGEFTVPVIRWMILTFPWNQTIGPTPTTIDVTIPVILDDPNRQYQLVVYAGPDDRGNGSSSTYVTRARLISGYSAKIAKAFSFKFNANDLTVSANTGNSIATLGVSWVIEDAGGIRTTQAFTKEAQNPSVNLPYSDMGTPTQLPAIKITLQNPQTFQEQEADVQISINASDAQTKEAKQNVKASQDPSMATAKKKPSFTWGTFSQTVLGAILKYFAV